MPAKKEENNTKAFDVVEPKDAKLDIGSKPMVIGHKSAADSTLATEQNDGDTQPTPKEEAAEPNTKVRIEPLKEEEKSAATTQDDVTKESNQQDTTKPPSDENGDAATKKDDVSSEEVKKDRDFVAEAENEEKNAQEAEAAREEKVEELKKSKKYHVSIKEKSDTAFGKIFALIFAVLVSVIGVYALADADIIPGGELLPMRFIGSNEKLNEVEVKEVKTSNGAEETAENETEGPVVKVIDNEVTLEDYVGTIENWYLYELEGASIRLPDGLEFMSGVRVDYVTATYGTPVLSEGTRASVIPFDESQYQEVLPLVSIGYKTSDTETTELISDCQTSLSGLGEEEQVSSYTTESGVKVYFRFITNNTDGMQYTYYTFCSEDTDSQLYLEVNTKQDEDRELVSAMKKSLETLIFTD